MTEYTDYSLIHHNTFGLPARCHRFIEYSGVDELCEALSRLRADRTPWMHIGRGSNLVFVGDYEGTILHSALTGIDVEAVGSDEVLVTAGAGIVWDDLVAWTLQRGYYGLENLSLIPGEVGAAAVQNIGAYGVEAARFIDSVQTVDAATGHPATLPCSECRYAYRHSVFKEADAPRRIVTAVTFRLRRTFTPHLDYAALRDRIAADGIDCAALTADMLRSIIVRIRREKLPDPDQQGSAGSFFMNPVVDAATFAALQAAHPDIPHYPAPDGIKLSAGWLIDRAGWRGRSMGPAGVWGKQALVLVNLGGATGTDVLRLAAAVQRDVLRQFGITLRPEAILVGESPDWPLDGSI
ncbi:MAG: UDP-N-acetylmuramate dehydrogenase [Bacteroidales bacterium]|nr:UDP-N-acetylmuramate dehydrogenase [Bacteroidales bacterium]